MQGEGYRCELCVTLRMESIRLPIRDLNLDGFSRAEVREVSRVYSWELKEMSRNLQFFFRFISRIRFVLYL